MNKQAQARIIPLALAGVWGGGGSPVQRDTQQGCVYSHLGNGGPGWDHEDRGDFGSIK